MRMDLPKLVVLTGRRQSGKDTIAHHLTSCYGYVHVKFASPLKNAVRALFGFSEQQVEGTAKDTIDPVWGITPRTALQFIGTDIVQYQLPKVLGTDIGRGFFVKRLEQRLESFRDQKVVISDMRFAHELDFVRSRGAVVVRICRNTLSRYDADHHCSESDCESFDVDTELSNDEDIATFLSKFDDWLRTIVVNNVSTTTDPTSDPWRINGYPSHKTKSE